MDFILNCFRKPTKLDAATLDALLATHGGAGVSVAVLAPNGGDAIVRTVVAGVAVQRPRSWLRSV